MPVPDSLRAAKFLQRERAHSWATLYGPSTWGKYEPGARAALPVHLLLHDTRSVALAGTSLLVARTLGYITFNNTFALPVHVRHAYK